jgi:hypothetical protein
MQRSAVFLVLSLTFTTPAAFSAELGCMGGYNFRLGGDEIDTTHYRFRNFNANRTLTITAIDIYAFDGTALFNLSAGSFPATFNPVLGPHQTTGLNLEDLFGNNEAPNNFVQTVVTWEADRPRADPLYATAARITRARNAVTGVQGETKARAILTCRGERAGS